MCVCVYELPLNGNINIYTAYFIYDSCLRFVFHVLNMGFDCVEIWLNSIGWICCERSKLFPTASIFSLYKRKTSHIVKYDRVALVICRIGWWDKSFTQHNSLFSINIKKYFHIFQNEHWNISVPKKTQYFKLQIMRSEVNESHEITFSFGSFNEFVYCTHIAQKTRPYRFEVASFSINISNSKQKNEIISNQCKMVTMI